MEILGKSELRRRILEAIKPKEIYKPKTSLEIIRTDDGYRIDNLVCKGLPRSQASALLLLCNGLTQVECATVRGVSVSAIRQALHALNSKILGGNADGDIDGNTNKAVTEAFRLGILYFNDRQIGGTGKTGSEL